MIQINLLPDSTKAKSKPKKRSSSSISTGGPIIVLFALVAFGGVGALGFASWNSVHKVKANFLKLRAEKQAVEKEVDQFSSKAKEIKRLRQLFTNQWEVLQSLDPPDRILWAEKVNMLAELMPTDVFLTKVELEENVVEVEIESSIQARQAWEKGGKKGDKPEVVKKPVITYDFTLTGLATGDDNVEQFDNVIKFHDALVSAESTNARGETRRFMDRFDPNVEFETVEAVLYEGVPVNKFIFKLRTQPAASDGPKTLRTANAGQSKPKV